MECRSRLANRSDWPKANVGEQSQQLSERFITLGEENLDFLSGLCRSALPRPFVGDAVFRANST